jgi:hypothetical protein
MAQQAGERPYMELLIETAAVRLVGRGGRRRRAGFCSAVRRTVPVRTFGDWNDPPPGFVEVDFVAHAGTSAAGSFVQTMVLTDIATGWTDRMLTAGCAQWRLGHRSSRRRNDAVSVSTAWRRF